MTRMKGSVKWITIQFYFLNLHECFQRTTLRLVLEVAQIRVDNQAFGKLPIPFGLFCINTHTLFRCVRDYTLFVCRIEDTNPYMLQKTGLIPGGHTYFHMSLRSGGVSQSYISHLLRLKTHVVEYQKYLIKRPEIIASTFWRRASDSKKKLPVSKKIEEEQFELALAKMAT